MKEIIQGFYQKKHFWTRLILVIAAVILMGFALSWLLLVDLGTDPCTLLNQTIPPASASASETGRRSSIPSCSSSLSFSAAET